MQSEIIKIQNLLIGVWEYLPGQKIEFYPNGYSTGETEQPYTVREGFFEILIFIPSIGIHSGKILSYNDRSITILNASNLQTTALVRVRHF